MSKKVNDKGLRLDPIFINKSTWYYEEGKGICVVHESVDIDQFYIPWKKLLESVRRKYKNLK